MADILQILKQPAITACVFYYLDVCQLDFQYMTEADFVTRSQNCFSGYNFLKPSERTWAFLKTPAACNHYLRPELYSAIKKNKQNVGIS